MSRANFLTPIYWTIFTIKVVNIFLMQFYLLFYIFTTNRHVMMLNEYYRDQCSETRIIRHSTWTYERIFHTTFREACANSHVYTYSFFSFDSSCCCSLIRYKIYWIRCYSYAVSWSTLNESPRFLVSFQIGRYTYSGLCYVCINDNVCEPDEIKIWSFIDLLFCTRSIEL